MNHISNPQESIEKAIQFLETNGIPFERHDHAAVFTVDEVSELVSIEKGIRTKNLFVRDKKGRQHVLIVVPHDKSVDLMELGVQTGYGRVSFGSPERLMRHLGVEPGSVSLMGVINDPSCHVHVVIDIDIWNASFVRCHPLVNTATVVLDNPGMKRLFEITGHEPLVIEVPSR